MKGLIDNRHILDMIAKELLERSRITGLVNQHYFLIGSTVRKENDQIEPRVFFFCFLLAAYSPLPILKWLHCIRCYQKCSRRFLTYFNYVTAFSISSLR